MKALTECVLTLSLAMAGIGCAADDTESELGTVSQALFSGPAFYDSANQCNVGGHIMHCCPDAVVRGVVHESVMVGVDVTRNLFKCRPLYGTLGPSFVDYGTQRNGMHACLPNGLMQGLHVDQNLLLCVYSTAKLLMDQEYVDNGTQDIQGVIPHVCREDQHYAMAGIRVDRGQYTCDTDLNSGGG